MTPEYLLFLFCFVVKVTHFDSRCLASCVATTTAIAMMLQGHDVESEEGLQLLIDKAVGHALKVSLSLCFFLSLAIHSSSHVQYLEAEHVDEFKRHIKRDASMASLLSLELDEGSKIGYTLK